MGISLFHGILGRRHQGGSFTLVDLVPDNRDTHRGRLGRKVRASVVHHKDIFMEGKAVADHGFKGFAVVKNRDDNQYTWIHVRQSGISIVNRKIIK